MYKHVLFITFAYSLACLISGRSIRNMGRADNSLHLPTTAPRSESPTVEQMDRGARQTSGNSHAHSGDGYENSTSYSASGQEVAGDESCDVSQQDLREIQLNPLYAFSVMAELQHENFTASRRKRQGSLSDVVNPNQVCRALENQLIAKEVTYNTVVSCPSAGYRYVAYKCHFEQNRYPRYLVEAKVCQGGGCMGCTTASPNARCGEHNATVTVAEHSAGSCTWTKRRIQIRVGCRCTI